MKTSTTWLLFSLLFCCGFTLSHSQNDGDLRLAGFGSNPTRGKLEIYYNGEWGRVCSENTSVIAHNTFRFEEATVVCRQLGFGFALGYFVSNSNPTHGYRYGRGSSLFHLDKVQCNGSESHILRCNHGELGQASETCQDFYDITVECSDVKVPYYGEVRLSDGPSGTLELFSDDVWGAICFEGGFGTNQANAVCRQLGYTEATSFSQLSDAYEGFYWDLEGAALVDTQDGCFTSSLDRLPTIKQNTGCTPVHVQCEFNTADATNYPGGNAESCALTPEAPFSGTLRYVNSSLEVYLDNEWHGICFQNSTYLYFHFSEADVVCKKMGFPGARGFISKTTSQDSLKALSCTGIETSINECQISTVPTNQCEDGVSVECIENEVYPYGELSIRGGIGSAGQLVMYDGQRFLDVCDDSFTIADAQVACRQMGYSHAVSFHTGNYYGTTVTEDKFYLTGQCPDIEDHLLNCKQLSEGTCSSVVGIQCATSTSATPAVRLVNGDNTASGRTISGLLEVNVDGNWGPVGDVGFDHLAAHVVCTQLGYPTAKQVHSSSRFGGVSGSSYALNGIQCTGHEDTMLDCQYLFGVNGTQSQEQAALECSETFTVAEGSFRLTSDSNLTSGTLEISVHGVWMGICGASFTEDAATLACQEMGFERMESYCDDSCFGESSSEYTFYMNDLCTLTDGSLLSCDSDTHQRDRCNGTVGLTCVSSMTTDLSLPPSIETTTTMTMDTDFSPNTTTEDPTTSIIIPGLQNVYFYIIVGVVGALILFLVLIIVCCVCCCVAKRRKRTRATWRSGARMNGVTGACNRHSNSHHHNGTSTSAKWGHGEPNSKLKMEKVGDLDDPRATIEMNGFTHTPSSGTDSDPNLDYKQELSLDLEQERHHHYENLPQRANVMVSNTLYVEGGHSPASPPPGYDELEFLPSATST